MENKIITKIESGKKIVKVIGGFCVTAVVTDILTGLIAKDKKGVNKLVIGIGTLIISSMAVKSVTSKFEKEVDSFTKPLENIVKPVEVKEEVQE